MKAIVTLLLACVMCTGFAGNASSVLTRRKRDAVGALDILNNHALPIHANLNAGTPNENDVKGDKEKRYVVCDARNTFFRKHSKQHVVARGRAYHIHQKRDTCSLRHSTNLDTLAEAQTNEIVKRNEENI